MAICEKCGKTYITKECNYCYPKDTVKINSNITEKAIRLKKRDRATKGQYQAIAILGIAILIVSTLIFIKANANPLIGKWEGQVTLLGKQEIEFRKDRVIFMGMTSKVEYEKTDNEIIVTDATGMGTIYKIIDKNTIFCNMAGMKAVYKRIK